MSHLCFKINNYINEKPPPEYSILDCGSTKASQSEACVGRSPMLWHLYKANAIFATFPKKNTIFCPITFWAPSITLNVAWVENMALIGRTNIIPVIIIGKIDIEFPDIYISNKFIGTFLNGPNAMSHDFLIIRWLESFSLAISLCVWPTDKLYPGGAAISDDFCLQKMY